MPACLRLLLPALLLWASAPAQEAKPRPEPEWRAMFDGKSLEGWKETPFRFAGQVRIENGLLVLGNGKPLTGVNFTGSFPKSNYEVRFEAVRRKGSDFFASLTFPVAESFCTWITGGWGGDIVGLSSLDGFDASENDTRTYVNFEPGRWYAFRLRVTDSRITAWIDEQRLINVEIGDREVGLRYGDIELSAPVGFATFNTEGALRKIEYRELPAPQAR